MLRLYLFRARQWFYFIEIIELSCFTYIILTVSLNSMAICFGYEFSTNMIGFQEGYNKNFHIKCIEYSEKLVSFLIVLRYKDGDTRVMLVSNCGV